MAEPTAAEVAFVVADDQQTARVRDRDARAPGCSCPQQRHRTVLSPRRSPDNRAMMDVFRHAGFDVTSQFDKRGHRGQLPVGRRPTSSTGTSRIASGARRRRIDPAHPQARASIAVIGASRTPGTIGYELVHKPGARAVSPARVLPINPRAASIGGIPRVRQCRRRNRRHPIWRSSRSPPRL